MDIDLIFKIAAIGIIVSILNQVLSRSGREEQATMTTLAGLVVVLMMVAQKIAELFDLVYKRSPLSYNICLCSSFSLLFLSFLTRKSRYFVAPQLRCSLIFSHVNLSHV